MYKVKTDSEKNRLTVTLSGFISADEANTLKETIIKEASKLTPGFDVINDISNFRLGQDQAGLVLQAIIKYLVSINVNRVVRVVGSSQTGLIQFANYTGNVSAYAVKYVPTMKDAEVFLEK
jgi:hypothetical protein